jgi:DNA processing protein
MADQQEILNTILLTRLNYFSLAGMLELYRKVGSATLILEHKNNLRDILPDASDKLVSAIQNCEEARKRAEEELEYDIRYGIEPIPMNDDRYPQRLKDCDDAPLILFYKGNANLNQQRVINIVGTRHCTPYGEDLIRRFITDLKQLSPNVLIMSGLAYGVDIVVHRQALASGYETIGVLAHGLDDLYPRQHRETAARMIEQGGLLTEFFTEMRFTCRSLVLERTSTMSCSSGDNSGKRLRSMPCCLARIRVVSSCQRMSFTKSSAQVMSVAPLLRMRLLQPSL